MHGRSDQTDIYGDKRSLDPFFSGNIRKPRYCVASRLKMLIYPNERRLLASATPCLQGSQTSCFHTKGNSGNPKLCVTLHRRNAHLPFVNSAFVSVASLDFQVSGGYLNGFLNLARTQTPRTDTFTFYRAFFDDLDTLQIWIKLARANIVRMRNCMPENGALSTNITLHWHNRHTPVKTQYHTSQRIYVNNQYKNGT